MTAGFRCLGFGAVFLVQHRDFHGQLFDVLTTIADPTVWGALFLAIGVGLLACWRASWRWVSGWLIASMVATTMLLGTYVAERWSADQQYATWLPVVVLAVFVAKDLLVLNEGESRGR